MFIPGLGTWSARQRKKLLDEQCATDSAYEGIGAMIGGKAIAVFGLLANPKEYFTESLKISREFDEERAAAERAESQPKPRRRKATKKKSRRRSRGS